MARIVAIGDSITAGQHLHPASAWPYQMPGLSIRAAGVPGDTTRLGLERFPRDVQEHEPERVVIQFGHNDANRWLSDRGLTRVSEKAYAANLEEMIERCRAFGAVPYLCTLTPCWRSERHAEDVERYDQILRHVADEAGAHLVDVRAAFIGIDGLVMEDGLHLTVEGHRLYAKVVAATIR